MTDKMRITPAALAALADGDLGNFIAASTPGGIEAQEKMGQQILVKSEMLPIKCRPEREVFESLGIVFGKEVDELFVEAQLPEGWSKQETDHSMHSDVLDEQGRKRIGIFYKAAFYDRRADMYLTRRYSYQKKYLLDYDDPDYYTSGSYGAVVDHDGTVLWRTKEDTGPQPDKEDRDALMAWYDKGDKLSEQARQWLFEHYPDWENPLAYWKGDDENED